MVQAKRICPGKLRLKRWGALIRRMTKNNAVKTEGVGEPSDSATLCGSDVLGEVTGLVNSHHHNLRRNAFRTLGSWADAEDVCQDAYCKLLNSRALPAVRDLTGYVFKMIHNAGQDLLRRRRVREIATADERVRAANTARSAEDICESTDEFERLLRLIDELPERSRQVVLLYKFEELSLDQIAARLGIQKGSVTTRITHAMKYLSRALAKEGLEVGCRDEEPE